MTSSISPNLNYATDTSPNDITALNVTLWNEELITQREYLAPFEYLKNYSNAIFRNDTTKGNTVQNMMAGVNEVFTVDRELIGKGQTGINQLLGNEEAFILGSFSYQAQLVRHAVASNEFYINTNLGLKLVDKKRDPMLNAWAVKRKQNNDIARMLVGADSLHKLYGGGKVASASSITSANVLNTRSLVVMREILEAYNGHPVSMLNTKTMQYEQHSQFIYLVDALSANRLGLDPDWKTSISQYNANAGFDNPLAKIAYGQYNNMMVVKIDSTPGFGSALRPECMVATTGTSLADGASVAVQVGLPVLTSGTYTTYDSSSDKAYYTEFFKNMITASGVVNCPVVIKRAGVADRVGFTVVYTATYSLTLTNGSGVAYTPTAGDRIISLLSAGMGLGANAMISGYSSDIAFTNDMRDYDLNKGRGVQFWEGGAVIKDTQGQVPSIGLDFFYSPVLTAS